MDIKSEFVMFKSSSYTHLVEANKRHYKHWCYHRQFDENHFGHGLWYYVVKLFQGIPITLSPLVNKVELTILINKVPEIY
jgi:hypothetical protein